MVVPYQLHCGNLFYRVFQEPTSHGMDFLPLDLLNGNKFIGNFPYKWGERMAGNISRCSSCGIGCLADVSYQN
jgi:hypothetical protein